MTQLQTAPTTTCDGLLRRARELLAQGELATASAAGWDAAAEAMAGYSGPGVDFADAAQRLVKDYLGHTDAAEWVVSAMALSDNARYDWLNVDGISRRLDDVQRLAILVKDIAEPPRGAEDVLRRAWECLDNGYLIPASDKGWEASLLAAKAYADAIGYRYGDESHFDGDEGHFDSVMRVLEKEEPGNKEVSGLTYAAVKLRKTAVYCAGRSDPRYAEIFTEDVRAVENLVLFIQERVRQAKVGQFGE